MENVGVSQIISLKSVGGGVIYRFFGYLGGIFEMERGGELEYYPLMGAESIVRFGAAPPPLGRPTLGN